MHSHTRAFAHGQGLIRIPKVCSSDTPWSECTTSCPSEILAKVGANASEILKVAGAHELFSEKLLIWKKLEEHGISHADLLHGLCHVGHAVS